MEELMEKVAVRLARTTTRRGFLDRFTRAALGVGASLALMVAGIKPAHAQCLCCNPGQSMNCCGEGICAGLSSCAPGCSSGGTGNACCWGGIWLTCYTCTCSGSTCLCTVQGGTC